MTNTVNTALIFTLLASLAGCGGGSGGGSGGSSGSTSNPTPPTSPPPPTASQIIASAKDYSASELETAAKTLVEQRYTGETAVAEMDLALAHQAFYYLFADSIVDIPQFGEDDINQQIDSNGDLDVTFACYYGGSVTYSGNLTPEFLGNVSATFDECAQLGNGFAVTGSVALTVSELTDTNINISYYFDNLIWDTQGQTVKLSGYTNLNALDDPNLGTYSVASEQYVVFTLDDQAQVRLNIQNDFNSEQTGESSSISGDLHLSDVGKIAFEMDFTQGFPPYLVDGTMTFTGDKGMAFKFEDPYVRFLQDNDADGEYDVGTIVSVNEMMRDTMATKTLVALADVSLPPEVYQPYRDGYYDVYATTPVLVEPGYISDPDSSQEDLSISYQWYLNGDPLTDQTTELLPPGIAVFGDTLAVTILVSDGANLVESDPLHITVQDSPSILVTQNVPEQIMAGDMVQFSTVITDPDTQATDGAGILIAGPQNASIDENGIVTWQVPDTFLFPAQLYEFTFAIPVDEGDVQSTLKISLSVDSDTQFPIALSGIEVPSVNNSIHVGDFDGDAKNEILSTNGSNSVFLLEYKDGEYQQKWIYPFKLPTSGYIQQVLAANIDDDSELEIIVVTENGISLINGLDSLATIVLTTNNALRFAAMTDTNDDGVLEIAYLHSTDGYYSEDVELTVVSFDAPNESVFSTNMSDANQIIFANVDGDQNLELVSNNGRVYDAMTWQNQWLSGSQFGDSLVTAGDYNNDGIDEIAGADTWGAIKVFSAVDKTQLDSFDNFNTCTMSSANIDQDGADELLVGDCQWGNITAYKLTGSDLVKLWDVDMVDHGSSSLVAGDSDNDGELEVHWGTGTSHSGANSFIVADVSGDTATTKSTDGNLQLDSYVSAGWANVADNDERAIFFVPSTQNGYQGSSFVSINDSGESSLSSLISDDTNYGTNAVTTDFNNDGLGDLFMPLASYSGGVVSVVNLADETEHWKLEQDNYTSVQQIKAVDLNTDGSDDLLYSEQSNFNAVDVNNQTIIASYSFDGFINDFVADSNNEQPFVVVSFDNKLSYLTTSGSNFSEQFFIEQSCEQIELFNYDSDAGLELLCLATTTDFYFGQQLVVFDITDDSLVEVSRAEVSGTIIEIVADPASSTQQNLLVTTSSGNPNDYWDENQRYQIKNITSQGHTIWSSPPLVGNPTRHGLKARMSEQNTLELLLSTSEVMYWVK